MGGWTDVDTEAFGELLRKLKRMNQAELDVLGQAVRRERVMRMRKPTPPAQDKAESEAK